MADKMEFLLKWKEYRSNVVSTFSHLFVNNRFTDITLTCDGKSFKAHRIVLSACSPFFYAMFEKNPSTSSVVVLDNVPAKHLELILEYMYKGEVDIYYEELKDFLESAGHLKVIGLTEGLP